MGDMITMQTLDPSWPTEQRLKAVTLLAAVAETHLKWMRHRDAAMCIFFIRCIATESAFSIQNNVEAILLALGVDKR